MAKRHPKEPFKPTRACPHPACRTLHAVVLCAGLVFIATQVIALEGWHLLVSIVSTCAALAILRTVSWHGWSMRNADTVDDRPLTPWHTVDPKWATAAAATDAFLAVGGAVVVVVSTASPEARHGMSEAPSVAQSLVVLALSVLFIGFRSYAHYRATRPRQPRAAREGWFPRGASTSTSS